MALDPLIAGKTLDTIVHIGAGQCRVLERYQQMAPAQIILVEPNPEMIIELEAKIQGLDSVTLIPAALSQTAGRASLQVMNFADLSSLRRPSGLLDLLPGLRVVDTPVVDTITFEDLCDPLTPPAPGKANWLIIEAPGEEKMIAEALVASDKAGLFQSIQLHCGQTAHYKESAGADDVVQILRQAGYRLDKTWVEDDPDRPCFQFTLDVQAIENKFLKSEQKKLETQLSDLAAQLNSSKTDLETRNSELTQLRSQLTAATAKTDEAQTAAAERAKTLETRNSELTQLRSQLAAATAKTDEAQTAAAERAKTLETQAIQIRDAKSDFENRFQQQEDTLKKDLGIALRLQMLARNDHQELQQRFEQLRQEKHSQEELLIKLTQKLGNAAGYLRQLEDNDLDIDTPLDTPSPAPRRAKRKSTIR